MNKNVIYLSIPMPYLPTYIGNTHSKITLTWQSNYTKLFIVHTSSHTYVIINSFEILTELLMSVRMEIFHLYQLKKINTVVHYFYMLFLCFIFFFQAATSSFANYWFCQRDLLTNFNKCTQKKKQRCVKSTV